MCLVLRPGGVAEFTGGFLYHNPVRWSFDSDSGLLRLVPSNLTHDDASLFEQYVKQGRLYAFDSSTSTLTYKLIGDTARFYFAGFLFERPESLKDWEYEYSRKGCPDLLPERPQRRPGA